MGEKTSYSKLCLIWRILIWSLSLSCLIFTVLFVNTYVIWYGPFCGHQVYILFQNFDVDLISNGLIIADIISILSQIIVICCFLVVMSLQYMTVGRLKKIYLINTICAEILSNISRCEAFTYYTIKPRVSDQWSNQSNTWLLRSLVMNMWHNTW